MSTTIKKCILSFKWNRATNKLFSDCFGSKYLAPAYHHDRCERSLHMHLYVMQKSEILLTLLTFISLFILCLFIGLAGPNSVRLDYVQASKMLQQQSSTPLVDTKSLISEKYYIMTPLVSSYCQQLNLWIKFELAGQSSKTMAKTETELEDIGLGLNIGGNSNGDLDSEQIDQTFYTSRRSISVSSNRLIDNYLNDNHNNSRWAGDGYTNTNTRLANSNQIISQQQQQADHLPHNLAISLYLTVEMYQSTLQQSKLQDKFTDQTSRAPYHRQTPLRKKMRKKRQISSYDLYPTIQALNTPGSNERQLLLDLHQQQQQQQQSFTNFIAKDGVQLTRNLSCSPSLNPDLATETIQCGPMEIVHLTKLDYANYKFGIAFTNETIDKILKLHTINDNQLKEITFTLQSINTSFTILIIWFRFVLLLISITTTCLFVTCLYKYPFREWSLEQRWTTLLLVLLIASDNPLFPMKLIFDSVLPKLLDIMFDTMFLASLSLYWLCFSHGIRQTNRDIITFYLPKLLLVCSLWSITLYGSIWSIYKQSFEPNSDEAQLYNDTSLFKLVNVLFYLLLLIYLVYLVYLFSIAMAELRSMSFLDIRLKIQTFFCSFVLFVYAAIIWLNQSNGQSDEDIITAGAWSQYPPLLRLMPINYKISSAGACLSYHALNNLYLITCSYLYYPHIRSLPQSPLAEENSSLSIFKEDFCNEGEEDEEEEEVTNQDEEEIVYALDDIDISRQKTTATTINSGVSNVVAVSDLSKLH